MPGSITRTACPSCLAIGTLSITDRLCAQPIGSFSLAGVVPKVSARSRPVLTCSAPDCGFERLGEYVDGGTHAEFPASPA